MAIYKTFNDLVLSTIEHLRLVQPELDTKPGTVARDVFVDAPSQQLGNLYSQLRAVASLQSLFSASGSDLSKLGSNYGATRQSGNKATGTAVLTTNNIDVDILIPAGSVVTSRNGVNYETLDDTVLRSDSANVYRATATRLRTDLDLAAITDEFALELLVQSLTTGLSGNIGRFSLTAHNIDGITNITNVSTFSGGTNAESDDGFRTRILSIFAGSNTGTALGYETAIGIVAGVLDSEIVVPGDPLLIRDGTQVVTDSSGNLVISDPGGGGKVDLYVMGTDLQSEIDSFIYNDQSGNQDVVNPANDVILGQKGADTTLNAAQRRVTLIAADDLPNQPVENILTVAGSSSGANFVEKYTDENGRERGNYELSKDTGDFGGSPFGFDKLHWTSNKIELEDEGVTKGIFNGSDALNFSDVEEIHEITQDYLITNENSTKSTTNRNYVTLLNTPVRNVSRIVNITTGERYVVEEQNPDGTEGEQNTTGRIVISGSTLPVGTDTLQVDYTWIKPFDSKFDFDNLSDYNEHRSVQDSVDWSFGNLVSNEPATVAEDAYGGLTVTVSHPISKMITVNTTQTHVSLVASGTVTTDETVTNVVDIRRISDNAELFNTDARDGSLSGTTSIVLPTDSVAADDDEVTIRFNAADIFAPDGYDAGTFENEVITLPDGVISGGTNVLVSYVASVSTLIAESEITSLPAIKNDNKFYIDNVAIGEQPTSNLMDEDNNFTYNLRRASSHIQVAVKSVPSPGSITVYGKTLHKVEDALVVVTAGSGYEVDLESAITNHLGSTSVPSDIKVIKLFSFERVNVDNSGDVTSVDNTYDIVNYKLRDNSYDLVVALKDTTINDTKIILPQTSGNVAARLNTADIVRVSFYYLDTIDYELLYFSKNGTHITNKVFTDITRVALSSGFKDARGTLKGKFVVANFNQPTGNTSYSVDYDYVAPKENERITVTFNHNALMNTCTNAIENVRPITADVLIKAAEAKVIDVNLLIVLLPEFVEQEQTVKQDAVDAVTSFLDASSLGTTVDASDIINVLYSVSGIDRVRVINFSVGDSGNLLSMTAEKNEYLSAGTVTITVEER